MSYDQILSQCVPVFILAAILDLILIIIFFLHHFSHNVFSAEASASSAASGLQISFSNMSDSAAETVSQLLHILWVD